MADSPIIARMKERKADLEAKLQRLNKIDEKSQPGLDLAKKQTSNGIAQLEAELKRSSQPSTLN